MAWDLSILRGETRALAHRIKVAQPRSVLDVLVSSASTEDQGAEEAIQPSVNGSDAAQEQPRMQALSGGAGPD
jgi:hypothetical protein